MTTETTRERTLVEYRDAIEREGPNASYWVEVDCTVAHEGREYTSGGRVRR